MERSTLSASVAIVEALGTAWTVHSLYPDPASQPAFRRAIESIRGVIGDPITLDLDVGGFLSGGVAVATDREGADRLAKRCYLHHIESVMMLSPPTEDEVARLFAALDRDEKASMAAGGIEAALRRGGVSSFTVVQRSQLATGAREQAIDRDPAVREILENVLSPAEFASRLIEESGGDPERLADLLHSQYRETLDKVTDDDVDGREAVVQAFVEAFFYFDEPGQIACFRRFLSSDHQFDGVFLDQFAGHELARLAPRLDSQGLSLLLDYARVATDQADGRPQELLGILRNPEALQSMREVAAAKVQERLTSIDDAAIEGGRVLAAVRDRFPNPQRYFYDALEVFRGLLAVEDRDRRFARLMRIWVGKVSDSIRRRQFRRAELWLRAATTKPTYPVHRQSEVDEALGLMATAELMGVIVEAAGKNEEAAGKILHALGPKAANALLDLLADEQSAPRRRMLMRVVADVGKQNPAPLLGRLGDERWYMVRNVLWALRESGSPLQADAIVPALSHADHRVRVEALRVVASAAPEESVPHLEAALKDSAGDVRTTALTLLGSAPGDRAEEGLITAASDRRLGLAERVTAIEALGARRTPPAEAALGRLGNKRFVLSGSARTVRDTARKALNS